MSRSETPPGLCHLCMFPDLIKQSTALHAVSPRWNVMELDVTRNFLILGLAKGLPVVAAMRREDRISGSPQGCVQAVHLVARVQELRLCRQPRRLQPLHPRFLLLETLLSAVDLPSNRTGASWSDPGTVIIAWTKLACGSAHVQCGSLVNQHDAAAIKSSIITCAREAQDEIRRLRVEGSTMLGRAPPLSAPAALGRGPQAERPRAAALQPRSTAPHAWSQSKPHPAYSLVLRLALPLR